MIGGKGVGDLRKRRWEVARGPVSLCAPSTLLQHYWGRTPRAPSILQGVVHGQSHVVLNHLGKAALETSPVFRWWKKHTERWRHLPKFTQLASGTPGPLAHVCLTPSRLATSTHEGSQHVWPSSESFRTGAGLNLPLRLSGYKRGRNGTNKGTWVQTQGSAGSWSK